MLDESQRKGAHRKLDLVDPLGIEEQKEGIPPGKTVVNVVADYLRAVKDHTLQTISKKHLGEKFWETTPIEYHLTVPAVSRE